MGQLLDEAIVFATHAHAGQVRKMANTPYILHPLEVASIIAVFCQALFPKKSVRIPCF